KGRQEFFARSSARKHPLSVDEIRAAFASAGMLAAARLDLEGTLAALVLKTPIPVKGSVIEDTLRGGFALLPQDKRSEFEAHLEQALKGPDLDVHLVGHAYIETVEDSFKLS